MSFLTALSNGAQGFAQGQSNAQAMQQKAQLIQQAQMALDEQKKQLAANAATFANMGQGGGGAPPMGLPGSTPMPSQAGGQMPPMTQPMPPGQASQPSQPSAPAIPPGAGGAPAGGPASPGGQQPAPQQPAGGDGGGQDQINPADPQAPVKLVMGIAQEIKSRNPGIDPQTLFYATQNVINMSKGLDPGLRAGAQVVVQNMREQGANARNANSNDTREDIAGQNIGSREKIAGQNNATRMAVAKEATDRAVQIQAANDKRYASGQENKAQQVAVSERMKSLTSALSAETKRLGTLKDGVGAPLPDEDPRVKASLAKIKDIQRKMDLVASSVNVPEQPAAGGGAAPANDGFGNMSVK